MEDKKPNTKVEPEVAEFFEEIQIPINMDDVEEEESFSVFMRPLRVRDLRVLNRVADLQAEDENSEQAAMMLVSLMVTTLNVTGDELPVEATSGLVGKMISYNFPKTESGPKDKKSDGKNDLMNCFDFLISHGHDYRDILEYPIPLFHNFIKHISERSGGAKKKPVEMDPLEAFQKLGLPIKKKGEK